MVDLKFMTAGEYMAMDADEIENYGTYTAKQELIDLKIKYKELEQTCKQLKKELIPEMHKLQTIIDFDVSNWTEKLNLL